MPGWFLWCYVEVEELSDLYSTGVVNAIAAAATREVAVRVSCSRTRRRARRRPRRSRSSRRPARTSSNPYIHAKAIGYNRELGVIFDVPTELAKVEAAIAGDFAHGTAQ